MKKKFITTTEKETADRLEQLGFTMVADNGSSYVFNNSPILKFSALPNEHVVYTDNFFL